MKKIKVAALVLAMVMAMGVAGGCQSTPAASTPPPAQSAAGSTAPGGAAGEMSELPNNTLKITVGRPQFNEPAEGKPVEVMWKEKMEAYLGCKLDITWEETLWADYSTNQQPMMASGTFPDVMAFGPVCKDIPNQYGIDGMLVDLSKYKHLMGNYQKYIDGTTGKEAAIFNEDGSVYAFYDGYVNENNVQGAQSFTSFAYRFDALKEHDLKPATTLAEYEELCKKLKTLYPEAYPIGNSTKDYAFYRGFVGAFHTWDVLYWNGKEWVYGPTEDSFREMLKYLNNLYKQDLIDPEFVTDTTEQVQAKVISGKIMTVPTMWAGSVNAWNKLLASENSKLSWGMAYLPSKDADSTAWKWGSKMPGYTLSKNYGIFINSQTKNPDWIVKMIDYQYSDEMVDMMNWGVEGDTYKVNADGTKSYTDKVMSQDQPNLFMSQYGSTSLSYSRCGINFAPQVFEPITLTMKVDPWWSAADGYTEGQYWINSDKYGGEDSVAPTDRAPFFALSADESQMRASAHAAYENISKVWGANFIAGIKDPNNDADWNEYLTALSTSGVDMEGTIKMLNEKCQGK